ncbi:MAG: chemotaxis protein CheW [Actinomycetota bacterium]|nr:chemotaxis protein CheW [Actinomycetota bacterium]MDD5667223.1 chemotaxis protein CheW [Actinomycetota bacterium]
MADDTRSADEIQLVVFSLGREEFAVEVTQVREIMRMEEITRMPKSPDFVEGIINLRGQIIAVVELAKRLNLEAGERSGDTRIIVVEAEDIKVGMIVDSVSEVLRVSADAVEPSPTLATDVAAAYLRGVVKQDNRLIILLDLTKVLSLQEMAGLEF